MNKIKQKQVNIQKEQHLLTLDANSDSFQCNREQPMSQDEVYKIAFNSANDIIILIDNEGKIIDVNEKIKEVGGYDRDELVGKHLSSLTKIMTKESIVKIMGYFLNRMEGTSLPPYQVEMIRSNGKLVTLEINAQALKKDGKIVGDLAILRDITERKYIETKLKESEEFSTSLLKNAPNPLHVINPDLSIKYLNPSLEKLTGFSAIEILGVKPPFPWWPEEKANEYVQIFQEVTDMGTVTHERIFRRKNGELFWVEVRVNAIKDNQGLKYYLSNWVDITERKNVEEKDHFKARILDAATDSIIVFDNAQIIVYANEAACNFHGYTRNELVGKTLRDMVTGEELRRCLKERYKELLARGEIIFETVDVCIDKSNIPVEVRLNLIELRGKKYYISIARDITERRQSERKLKESEERFRQIATSTGEWIWEIDEAGRYKYSSSAVESMLGYQSNELVGKIHFYDLYPREVIKRTKQAFYKDSEQKRLFNKIINPNVHKNGHIVLLETSGVPIIAGDGKLLGYRGVCHDVTERKRMEDRLKRSAEEWRTTFDSISDFISIIDNDSRLMRVNKACAQIFNKEPKELIGKTCYNLFHGTKEPKQDCPHRQTMLTGKTAAAEFFEPNLGRYLEVTTSPIFNERGEVTGSVHVARDVTERKQIEQQLMLSDRLASIGELVSGIAHEINNPLTGVVGFSQLLMEKDVAEDIKEDLSLIHGEAQRAANIVKNLLTFARKHPPIKQLNQINNVIDDVLKLRAYEQKVNNIGIVKKFAGNLPEVNIDYFQMQQVFLNLIVNAEYFMIKAHNRGILTITTEVFDNAVRVSFADDGPGIPQGNLNRLFNPFFTTKEVGKGTGLGLSICHGIVTEHGGKIHADSQADMGATFIVELPINSI